MLKRHHVDYFWDRSAHGGILRPYCPLLREDNNNKTKCFRLRRYDEILMLSCSLSALWMLTGCLLSAFWVLSEWSLNVCLRLSECSESSRSIPEVFLKYSWRTYSWSIPEVFLKYSWSIPEVFLKLSWGHAEDCVLKTNYEWTNRQTNEEHFLSSCRSQK